MPIKTELVLTRSNFQKNWKRTIREVKTGAREMKKETQGVGDEIAEKIKGKVGKVAGIAGIGLGISELVQSVRATTQAAQEMVNLSTSLQEPIDSLVKLRHATNQMGLDFETATELSRELEDRLGDLGNSEPTEVMERLGLEIESLMGMPIDQKLLTLADAFEKNRESGVAYSDMLKLLGDSVGEQLLPLLSQGKIALEDMFSQAPQMIDQQIIQMARFNEELNKTGSKLEGFKAKYLGSILGVGEFLSDVLSTGSIDEALLREGERQSEFLRKQSANADGAAAKAKAIKDARDAEQATVAEEKAARELATEMERLLRIKEAISDTEINLLPDDQKVGALQQKLNDFLEAKTDGSIFKPSLEGLQSMADSREFKLSQGGTDREGVTEAFSWLKEARDLQIEIDKLVAKQADDELDKATEERDALMAAREQAAKGEFELMNPQEQFSAMRDRLSDSLGIDIKGAGDLETGLTNLRDEVKKARESGDMAAEKAALVRLTEAQEQVGDFREMGERLDDAAQSNAPAGQVGEMGSLINQIFGRDPQQQQIERLSDIDRKLRDNNLALDQIITRMDLPPVRDEFDET